MGGKFNLACTQVSSVLQRRHFSASAVPVLAVSSAGREAEPACETSTGQNWLEHKALTPQLRKDPPYLHADVAHSWANMGRQTTVKCMVSHLLVSR